MEYSRLLGMPVHRVGLAARWTCTKRLAKTGTVGTLMDIGDRTNNTWRLT